MTIGGATYARTLPKAVPFGPIFPGKLRSGLFVPSQLSIDMENKIRCSLITMGKKEEVFLCTKIKLYPAVIAAQNLLLVLPSKNSTLRKASLTSLVDAVIVVQLEKLKTTEVAEDHKEKCLKLLVLPVVLLLWFLSDLVEISLYTAAIAILLKIDTNNLKKHSLKQLRECFY